MDKIENRMKEIMKPIDDMVISCHDRQDALMMACAMLQRTREIFDHCLGVNGRMKMFHDYATKENPSQITH